MTLDGTMVNTRRRPKLARREMTEEAIAKMHRAKPRRYKAPKPQIGSGQLL